MEGDRGRNGGEEQRAGVEAAMAMASCMWTAIWMEQMRWRVSSFRPREAEAARISTLSNRLVANDEVSRLLGPTPTQLGNRSLTACFSALT
jgi:hypothetical protein